jgi:hypothetical protein
VVPVTCYHRHLKELFGQLEIAYDADGRRRVHTAIVGLLHLPAEAGCPEVWAGLKAAYGASPGAAPDLARDLAGALSTGGSA